MLTPTIDTASTNTVTSNPTTNDLGTQDVFLQMLIAQMQYQDPLNPQDPTQMSSQLAQFNMVEQQTNTNALLEQLVSNSNTTQTNLSSSDPAAYLGRTATVALDMLNYTGSSMPFTVALDSNASSVNIQIIDANGNAVRNLQAGSMSAGNTAFSWDGLTDNAVNAPPGVYQILVQATDSMNQPVNAGILQQAQINTVRFTTNGYEFVVAGIAVPQSSILELTL